ncbi:MAG: transketolase C-terminal domain-containing protein [Patescibacteria group bacterium]|nr:transketolase C-terminal domain-containing protein [Patescibacteria group bacterium]
MNIKPRTMRDSFIEAVCERMDENKNIFFVTADCGAPALDKLKEDFSDRFINVGIAEQNLINVAAGLALEGCVVYAYAIAPFLTMRAYEQIRQNLSIASQVRPVNVNLIGVGAGMSYVVSGPTHHCFEDIAIMRLMPNMTVFSPSDWKLAADFAGYTIHKSGPKYLRFDGKTLPLIYKDTDNIVLENGFYKLLNGDKVCIISTGYMTHKALKVASEFQNVGVIDVFILKPLNEKLLFEAIKNYRHIITVEETFINNGGLDCLVSKVIRDNRPNIGFDNLGISDKHIFELGNRDYLHKLNGLDEENIKEIIWENNW